MAVLKSLRFVRDVIRDAVELRRALLKRYALSEC
jgi:hypothetical protein